MARKRAGDKFRRYIGFEDYHGVLLFQTYIGYLESHYI